MYSLMEKASIRVMKKITTAISNNKYETDIGFENKNICDRFNKKLTGDKFLVEYYTTDADATSNDDDKKKGGKKNRRFFKIICDSCDNNDNDGNDNNDDSGSDS